MREVSTGRVAALAELYDRFCERAYGVAHSVCLDESCAEDAVHDAFVAIWRGPEGCDVRTGTVAAWLLTMVYDRAHDVARRSAAHPTHGGRDERRVARRGPANVDGCIDEAGRTGDALASLPDEQRLVIALALYGRLSHTDIATHLGMSPGTVKRLMRLGLHTLCNHQQSKDATCLNI